MKIGSLFSGIGGLELGLECAGLGPVIWQAESDPYARAVLAKHWPGVRIYDDVRKIDEAAEWPDIICGGFPCQDISYAGKGAGIAGARSGLWTEFARIVRTLRPRFVVMENVPALLARGMGVVLGDLAASGYDAEWDCIPAAAVGAPHRRDRVFIVAYSAGGGWAEERTIRPEQLAQRFAGGGAENSDCECERLEGIKQSWAAARAAYRSEHGRDPGWWEVEPPMGRVADGVPARVDRLRCLGNAVVPQVAEIVGRRIKELMQ